MNTLGACRKSKCRSAQLAGVPKNLFLGASGISKPNEPRSQKPLPLPPKQPPPAAGESAKICSNGLNHYEESFTEFISGLDKTLTLRPSYNHNRRAARS